ncbi:hypothetical protein BLOT_000103 [Blomia tropicalis]|nr:hypothetical protein BLOT_000103 [Blomia tropicalis]
MVIDQIEESWPIVEIQIIVESKNIGIERVGQRIRRRQRPSTSTTTRAATTTTTTASSSSTNNNRPPLGAKLRTPRIEAYSHPALYNRRQLLLIFAHYVTPPPYLNTKLFLSIRFNKLQSFLLRLYYSGNSVPFYLFYSSHPIVPFHSFSYNPPNNSSHLTTTERHREKFQNQLFKQKERKQKKQIKNRLFLVPNVTSRMLNVMTLGNLGNSFLSSSDYHLRRQTRVKSQAHRKKITITGNLFHKKYIIYIILFVKSRSVSSVYYHHHH